MTNLWPHWLGQNSIALTPKEERINAVHELSLCRSIYGIVQRAAGQRPVVAVSLDVGHLRQVIPDTLEYCWTIICQGTALDGSVLQIRQIEAVITCDDCGELTRLGGLPILRCGSCQGTRTRVISGEEFLVRSVEVGD